MVETPAAALSVAKVSDTAGAKFSAGESDVAFPAELAGPAAVTIVAYTGNPFPSAGEVGAGVLEINVGRKIADLAEPILLSLPVLNGSAERLACAWWSVEEGRWAKDGCAVAEAQNQSLVCACTHLTVFSAVEEALEVRSEVNNSL